MNLMNFMSVWKQLPLELYVRVSQYLGVRDVERWSLVSGQEALLQHPEYKKRISKYVVKLETIVNYQFEKQFGCGTRWEQRTKDEWAHYWKSIHTRLADPSEIVVLYCHHTKRKLN